MSVPSPSAGSASAASSARYSYLSAAIVIALWTGSVVAGLCYFGRAASLSPAASWLGLVGSVTLVIPAGRLLWQLRTAKAAENEAVQLPSPDGKELGAAFRRLAVARTSSYSPLDAMAYAAGVACLVISFALQLKVSVSP